MANFSAKKEQFWVLQVPAAGLCMQEAVGKLLRHAAACKTSCERHHLERLRSEQSYVSLLLCSMTEPFNAAVG